MNKEQLRSQQDVIEYLRENSLSENFCIIPFINIILGPGGDISVCRQKGTEHVIGSLKNNSLKEIWNGETLQSWRKEFLEGKPKICEHEVKYVHCNLSPELYWQNDLTNLSRKMKYPFQKLTANLNGQCNIKCVMCKVWKQENGYYTEENFWKNARTEIFPFIKEVEMLSGEPLIQDDTFKLIDELLQINQRVEWSFTTNGMWDFEGKIESCLAKLKIRKFIFSIDSLNSERFEKIRVGGNLKKTLDNVEKIKEFGKKAQSEFTPTIHFLIMTSNYDEVVEFLDYCRDKKLKYILDLCDRPNALSLLHLREEDKIRIAKQWLIQGKGKNHRGLSGILLRMISQLDIKTKKNLLLEILENTPMHEQTDL